MATMTESDFQRKLAGNFRISPADLARLSPEQQQLYQQKMLQAAAPASLQGAFGAPQAAAGGVPVDHAHGATLAQIAANQQAQLEQLNKAGMLKGIRQSPKNTNYDHKPGLDYLRSADEVAARQDAWQQHTGAKDALRMQSARDAVSAKKDEQSKRVSQSVFGPDGVAHTAGGGRVMMMPDGSFGYSTPAGQSRVNPSQVYNAPGGPMSVGEARGLGPVDKNAAGPLQAAQMDAENVRAQDRKATALDMLAGAQMQGQEPTQEGNVNVTTDIFEKLKPYAIPPVITDKARKYVGSHPEIGQGLEWVTSTLGKAYDAITGAQDKKTGEAPILPPGVVQNNQQEQQSNSQPNIPVTPQSSNTNNKESSIQDFINGLINPVSVFAPELNQEISSAVNNDSFQQDLYKGFVNPIDTFFPGTTEAAKKMFKGNQFTDLGPFLEMLGRLYGNVLPSSAPR